MNLEINAAGKVFAAVQFYDGVDVVFPQAVLHAKTCLILRSIRVKGQILLHIRIAGNHFCHQIHTIDRPAHPRITLLQTEAEISTYTMGTP